MAGHSRWTQIKRQKGVTDARRGQLFTKLAREIMVAVREGGGNPETNTRLRLAIQKARDSNMPMDNIERAIRRALGTEAAQEKMEELVYEGYGPGGVAILARVLTDNRNRTTAEIRSLFARGGGNLGETGCVSWLFQTRGVISVETEPEKAEEIALLAIDAGAMDFKIDGTLLEIYSQPEELEALRQALEAKGVKITSGEISLVPTTILPLDEKTAEQNLRLLDKLEELDEVQKVFTNADFPEAVLERYKG